MSSVTTFAHGLPLEAPARVTTVGGGVILTVEAVIPWWTAGVNLRCRAARLVILAGGWSPVKVLGQQNRCNRPTSHWSEIRARLVVDLSWPPDGYSAIQKTGTLVGSVFAGDKFLATTLSASACMGVCGVVAGGAKNWNRWEIAWLT